MDFFFYLIVKCIYLVYNIYIYQIYIYVLIGFIIFCVLVDKVVMRVINLMKRDLYDIVKVDWFKRCLDVQIFILWYEKINF